MDPAIMQLLQMYQGSHQGQPYPGLSQGGMFGGGQMPMGQPQQQPQMQQPQGMPAMQQPEGQLPAMGDPAKSQHHGGGFNPLMMLSPMGYLMAKHPKYGLAAMSPGIGIANLLGAFK